MPGRATLAHLIHVLEACRKVASRALMIRVERALPLPCPVVAVGGATLGGSGKTPLAIACTRELALAGNRTALVGHAYRAAPVRPRFVQAGDGLDEVGDEALVAARALDGLSAAHVAVAPRRAAAMAFAARWAAVLVLDGVAQTRPARATLALLAVDAEDPWGAAGDLHALDRLRLGSMRQAPTATLVGACDAVVPMLEATPLGRVDPTLARRAVARFATLGRPVWPAHVLSRGAWVGGSLLTWGALRARRVGLITAVARPDRIVRSLEKCGVVPVVVLSARDHGPVGRRVGRLAKAITVARQVDVWVATPKCALHAAAGLPAGEPLALLDHTVVLAAELRAKLHALAAP